jgi:hypothetical protein
MISFNNAIILDLLIIITLLDVIMEYSLNIMTSFTEVGEQIPDATAYIVYGHWSFSLKNPYYDIINVTSFWIAILHIMLGEDDIINAVPNMVLYFTIALLILLSVYIIYRKANSQGSVLLAILIAFATPYITFIMVPPAISAMFALLTLTRIFNGRKIGASNYITILILSITGMLTHATSIAILTFSLLSFLTLLKLNRMKSIKYIYMLEVFIVIYIILSFIRFVYSTAYLAIRPYYADFLGFLNFLVSPSGAELRMTEYEQWSPLFTSFSWTVFPALSAAYVLLTLFKKRHSHIELLAFALSLAGLVLIAIGFIGSKFSNSFSRESAYPGYLLLFLGSFEPLRKIYSDKVGRIVMTIIIVIAIISGLFTIKNAPWLYAGKVPFLTYRPPTPSETLLARKLLTLLNSMNEFRNIELIQSFDPETYIVKMIGSRLIDPSNPFSPPPINVQAAFDNILNNNVVFNSPSLYVLWR